MKVFSNNAKKKKQGLGAIAKLMEAKGIDGPTRKKIQDLLVGSATIGGSVYAAKDTTNVEIANEVLKNLDPSISQYFE
jgi:DUF1009 family protein